MAVILIIEDDAFIRQIAEMALQDWGYQTLAADGVVKHLSGASFTWRQPAVGVSKPLITDRAVDFPAPFGPSSAATPWRGTEMLTPWRTSMRP